MIDRSGLETRGVNWVHRVYRVGRVYRNSRQLETNRDWERHSRDTLGEIGRLVEIHRDTVGTLVTRD